MDERRFRRILLDRYRRYPRSFPWRQTRDPYRVLMGEVLLQRTRGEHVAPGQVLASESTKVLVEAEALRFVDRGERDLRGLGGNHRTFEIQPAGSEGDTQP